jgi:hypothetical protein
VPVGDAEHLSGLTRCDLIENDSEKEIVSVLLKKSREPKLERLLTIKIYR